MFGVVLPVRNISACAVEGQCVGLSPLVLSTNSHELTKRAKVFVCIPQVCPYELSVMIYFHFSRRVNII